jgi:hypothetical protein
VAANTGDKKKLPKFVPRHYARKLDFGTGPSPVWYVPEGGTLERAQAAALMHAAARCAYLASLREQAKGFPAYDAVQFMLEALGDDDLNVVHLERVWRGLEPWQATHIAAVLAYADQKDRPDADILWEQLRQAGGLT